MTFPTDATSKDLERKAAFLVALAQAGIPPDTQELLIHGNPDRGIAPDALGKGIAALAPPSAAPVGSLLRKPTKAAPAGCYCKDICYAPVIMGRQQPCRRAGGVPGQPAPKAPDAAAPGSGELVAEWRERALSSANRIGEAKGLLSVLADVADVVNAHIDEATYSDRRKLEDWPDDHAFDLSIPWAMVRNLNDTICKAQRWLKDSALTAAPPTQGEGALDGS